MTDISELAILKGQWHATSQLWLSPGEPVRTSSSEAEIADFQPGQFTELRYSWSFEGQPQQGRIIFGRVGEENVVKAVWFDTWHMSNQFMLCEGQVEGNGGIWVRGAYSAPPGPDWGWKITIEPCGKDAFNLLMHNITPQGELFLAVQAAYIRQA